MDTGKIVEFLEENHPGEDPLQFYGIRIFDNDKGILLIDNSLINIIDGSVFKSFGADTTYFTVPFELVR